MNDFGANRWIGSSPAPVPNNALRLAQADLAARNYQKAYERAEALLRGSTQPDVRAPALLVAADAAYGMRSYPVAAARYGEFWSRYQQAPDAVRAGIALGWAELRRGHSDAALRAWADVAAKAPRDPRAPLALTLAAEQAALAGDTVVASAMLERLVGDYASTSHGTVARLSRSVLAVERQKPDDAVRDMRRVVESGKVAAVYQRRRVIDALAVPGAEAALESVPASDDHDGVSSDMTAASISDADPLQRFANAVVRNAREREKPAPLLHALVLVAAGTHGWHEPRTSALANRLADAFPTYPSSGPVLSRVATAAAAARDWRAARSTWDKVVARYPHTTQTLDDAAMIDIAEAHLRTGAAGDAKARLDRVVGASTQNEHGLRALLLLAEANEALGDQRAALAVYDRLRRDHPQAPWTADRLLAHARLLQGAGNRAAARPVLEQVLQRGDTHALPEATYRLGEITSAEGHHASAAEWYMSAAYLANGTTWKPQALLGAARSLVALNEMNEALIVYQKLLGDPASAREVSGEAAYGAGDVLRRTGRHEAAIQMFLAASRHVPNSVLERRALVGALRCFIATGDRSSAETIYRRLLGSNTTEPELLAEARKVLAQNRDQ